MKKFLTLFSLATAGLVSTALTTRAADEKETTVKGEIVDLACYLDHGASGAKHAECGETCISSGLPVGIKSTDGKLYTVIGEHKPINKELAPFAGKTVSLKGKVAEKDGVNLLENAELVK